MDWSRQVATLFTTHWPHTIPNSAAAIRNCSVPLRMLPCLLSEVSTTFEKPAAEPTSGSSFRCLCREAIFACLKSA
jgi:hypothetical protein